MQDGGSLPMHLLPEAVWEEVVAAAGPVQRHPILYERQHLRRVLVTCSETCSSKPTTALTPLPVSKPHMHTTFHEESESLQWSNLRHITSLQTSWASVAL